jgi:hypothetical protein
MEIFINIIGYEKYAVSNIGRIINNTTGKILKPTFNKYGYTYISLCYPGGSKKNTIHQIVAKAFLPNPENKTCVDHINNIKSDNRIENLRWATISENGQNQIIGDRNKTGVKGVSFNGRRYIATISIDKKSIVIGRFLTLAEATEARKLKALEVYGEFMNPCERLIN